MNAIRLILGVSLFALAAVAQAAPHGIYPTREYKALMRTLNTLRAPGAPSATDAAQQLKYYGGPVIGNAKVYAVFWGSDVDSTTQKQIGGFFATAVNSTYMDWLKEYNTSVKAVDGRDGTHQTIGRGTYVKAIMIKPAHTAKALDDKDIQAELDAQIDAGVLPAPDANTLYMTYFPPGISITIDNQGSCSTFCAYHEGFVSKKHGNVFYGVMPDLGGMCSLGCGGEPTQFDNLTVVSSHELIEAVTDPFPTPGNSPAFPQAWNTTDGNEVGDLCAGTDTQLASQGLTYMLQQEFDNATAACAPGPYQSP